jgi:HK97 family phage major capsid protein
MNEWEKLLARAEEKAKAAKAIYASESPDEGDITTADGLLAEAEALRGRANKLKAADAITDEAEAAKAARLALENAPATNDNGGYATTESLVPVTDERNDTPYKHVGKFLQDVRQAAGGVVPEKLAPLRGDDAADEGGFSLRKALGDQFVGSLYESAQAKRAKAISGMSELVPQDGGILVGTDFQTGIMGRVYDVGQLLQMADMTPVSANSNSMAFFREKETSRVDGSRRGGIRAYWASEADEKTSSKPAFEKLRLELYKVIGLVYATDELLADASALGAWVMSNLPEELRFKIEDAMMNGTGAGMPQGIIGDAATVTVAKETGQAADTIVSENVQKMWSRRWVPKTDYVWLINQDCGPQLWGMSLAVGTGGSVVYMPPGGLSNVPYATLMGRPVIETEYNATIGTVGDIMLVSWSEYQMIEKGGMQSASSIHVRFIYDETVFRFVTRVDGKPKWSSELTPFKGTNTVSPIVELASRD